MSCDIKNVSGCIFYKSLLDNDSCSRYIYFIYIYIENYEKSTVKKKKKKKKTVKQKQLKR